MSTAASSKAFCAQYGYCRSATLQRSENTNDLILMIDSGWSSMYLLISALSRLCCSSRKRSATESKQAAAWFCETRRFLAGCEEAWEPDIVAVASGRVPQAFFSQSHLGLWPVRAVACGRRWLSLSPWPSSAPWPMAGYHGWQQVCTRDQSLWPNS